MGSSCPAFPASWLSQLFPCKSTNDLKWLRESLGCLIIHTHLVYVSVRTWHLGLGVENTVLSPQHLLTPLFITNTDEVGQVSTVLIFQRRGKGGTERLRNLPVVTQPTVAAVAPPLVIQGSSEGQGRQCLSQASEDSAHLIEYSMAGAPCGTGVLRVA